MTYGLSSAATAAGINKSTVLRAIKSGKISATKSETGKWQIDPAEFHRVYPPFASSDARPEAEQRDRIADALVSELRATITLLREQRGMRNGNAMPGRGDGLPLPPTD
jgi:hypothetical protein